MPLSYRAYDLALRCLQGLSPPLGLWNRSKVGRGIRGRIVSGRALRDWGREYREEGRPVAWFHAPSVGESLQARAVMNALMELEPELQLAYTFFSPSAEEMLHRMPIHAGGYLPWDTRPEMGSLLDHLRPDLLAFTKTEVWPILVTEARNRGIPTVLVAATLPPGARRLRGPARRFLAPAFGALDRVLAIAEEDGKRFRRLGVAAEAVEVTGDPAVDSAIGRVEALDEDAPHLHLLRDAERPTVVAGSTWPADEEVLLPALRIVGKEIPGLRVVVAPHEPTPNHVEDLLQGFREMGRSAEPLSRVEEGTVEGEVDDVVVDRVGVLAELYTLGQVAYVGGGFHRHGLHSVLEPAAAGSPVLFGPRHENARAASELVDEGGGSVVRDPESLAEALARWLRDEGAREEASERARRYVERHRGAAVRSAEVLHGLLKERVGSPGKTPPEVQAPE